MDIHGIRVAVFIDWLQTTGRKKPRLSMKGTKVSMKLKMLKKELQVSENWLYYVKGVQKVGHLMSKILGLSIRNVFCLFGSREYPLYGSFH